MHAPQQRPLSHAHLHTHTHCLLLLLLTPISLFLSPQSDIETAALAVGNPSELSGILANHSEAGELFPFAFCFVRLSVHA